MTATFPCYAVLFWCTFGICPQLLSLVLIFCLLQPMRARNTRLFRVVKGRLLAGIFIINSVNNIHSDESGSFFTHTASLCYRLVSEFSRSSRLPDLLSPLTWLLLLFFCRPFLLLDYFVLAHFRPFLPILFQLGGNGGPFSH